MIWDPYSPQITHPYSTWSFNPGFEALLSIKFQRQFETPNAHEEYKTPLLPISFQLGYETPTCHNSIWIFYFNQHLKPCILTHHEFPIRTETPPPNPHYYSVGISDLNNFPRIFSRDLRPLLFIFKHPTLYTDCTLKLFIMGKFSIYSHRRYSDLSIAYMHGTKQNVQYFFSWKYNFLQTTI